MHIIALIGMGRSGTSALTRGLKTVGIELGDNLHKPNSWNPTGFWEDDDILSLNEKILTKFGFRFDSLGLIENYIAHDSPELANLNQQAYAILQKKLSHGNYWAFKDPRTTRLLPFWQNQFKLLELEDSYIIAIRNPLSIARSYQERDKLDLEKSMLLWLFYIIPAINNTMGKKRLIVNYENLLNNPLEQLHRIKSTLNLQTIFQKSLLDDYVTHFLDKKLNRHHCTYKEFKFHEATIPLCLITYDLLNKLATDELTFDSTEFLSTWENITQNFNSLHKGFEYFDKLYIKLHSETSQQIFLLQTENYQIKENLLRLKKYINFITINGILKKPMKLLFKMAKKMRFSTSLLSFRAQRSAFKSVTGQVLGAAIQKHPGSPRLNASQPRDDEMTKCDE